MVAAETILSFDLTVNGHSVQYVSPVHPQLVDVEVTTDTNLGYLYLTLSELHSDPAIAASYVDRRIDLSQCLHNATSNITSCVLPNLLIMPANTTVTIPYRFHYGGGGRRGNITHVFQLDEIAPTVTSIETELCDELKCFVGSGIPTEVTIQLEDSVGTFHRHLIFYKLGSTTFNANNCSGTTCYGRATVTCGDEARLDLAVVSANGIPSQDDAGNPVTNPGEVTRVVCDAKAPANVNVVTRGTGVLGVIAEDGELEITATLTDAVTRVTMTAWTYEVQRNVSENATESIECDRTQNFEQECSMSIGNLAHGRNLQVPLVFTDAVGHETTSTLYIPRILKVANATTKPSFFTAKATAATPDPINRAALQLALDNAIDYPQFINYEIKRQSSGARIYRQVMDVESCQLVEAPESVDNPYGPDDDENWTMGADLYVNTKIFYPDADWDEPNRIDASFLRQDTSELPSETILVRCNLTLTVEKDDTIYTVPEVETLYWPVNLRNSKLGDPGEAFINKINEQRDYLEGDTMKLIGYADQLMATFSQLCSMQQVVNIISQYGLGTEGIGRLMMALPVGQALMQAGSGITGPMLMMSMSTWSGQARSGAQGAADTAVNTVTEAGEEAEGKLRQFCDWVHCNTAQRMNDPDDPNYVENKLVSADDEWLQGLQGVGGDDQFYSAAVDKMTGNLSRPDVSNSLIMSIATRCWSGVVFNLNKWRQIECGYLQCLKEQAAAGHTIAVCEETRGTLMCRQVLGEVFELPYVRTITNLMGNVNRVIQNPLILVKSYYEDSVCGEETLYNDISLKGFGCRLLTTLSYTDDFSYVTGPGSMSDQFIYPYQADLCQNALCEEEDCELTTNSLIEKLIPGLGYSGDNYRMIRRQANEREARERQTASATPPAEEETEEEPEEEAEEETETGETAEDESAPGRGSRYNPQTTATFYNWVEGMGNVFIQYYGEEATSWALMSNWGDEELADDIDRALNAERWKDDLCNPTGRFGDLTEDDGAVYAWQAGHYRAVLTFAAEFLHVGERADDPSSDQILYIASAVAVSPWDDNSYTATLEPGAKALTSEPVSLAEGEVVNEYWSLNSSIEYAQICITFTKSFPQPGADKRYCRPIQPSAYDRGGVTNETIDFGQTDPYESPWDVSGYGGNPGYGNPGYGNPGGGY